MPFEGLTQKPLSGSQITSFAEPELDRVAIAVDRPIELAPLAPDFDVGLVDMPPATALLRWLKRSNSSGAYRKVQRRIVPWSTEIPRSAIISSRSRRLKL